MPRKLSGFAIVTGASSGIGLELARLVARDGCDMLLVADENLSDARMQIRAAGARKVEVLEADLGTDAGIEALLEIVQSRQVDVLVANAGEGHGGRFLDQDWDQIGHIIATNLTNTTRLVHAAARQMEQRGAGHILVTGSIVADMPGTFNLTYNATKAFVVKFCAGLAEELAESPVTLTCLLPGAVDTAFFDKAGMRDTLVGRGPKYSPADVAQDGYDGLVNGRRKVVSGVLARLQYGVADVLPDLVVAKLHRIMARPLHRR